MSKSAEPEAARDAEDRLARRLTGLGAFAGALFLLGVVPALIAFPRVTWWWPVLCALMLLVLVTLAVGQLALPTVAIATLWRVVAVLCWLLQITTFAAWDAPDAAAVLPWLWTVQPAAVMLLALLLPAWKAIAWTVGLALAPLASALVFTGGVPEKVLHNTPLALTGITLVFIFAGVRGRLRATYVAEAAARESERRSALVRAEAAQQRALARLVHDEVLAVFTAALQFGGRIPDELRAEARAALDILEGGSLREPDETPVPTDAVAGELRRVVQDADPHATVDADVTEGAVPRLVVDAFAGAAGEAVRNSIRHGGSGVDVHVHIRAGDGALDLTARDDGPGFDARRVPAERLGVRESILGRIRALDGGSADIVSAPGEGTEVRLRWRR